MCSTFQPDVSLILGNVDGGLVRKSVEAHNDCLAHIFDRPSPREEKKKKKKKTKSGRLLRKRKKRSWRWRTKGRVGSGRIGSGSRPTTHGSLEDESRRWNRRWILEIHRGKKKKKVYEYLAEAQQDQYIEQDHNARVLRRKSQVRALLGLEFTAPLALDRTVLRRADGCY